ncbi:MAG: DTW domain-containing protein [Colwellia sp.]|nr:DTW domain-containing protein [Colwellia sp.]
MSRTLCPNCHRPEKACICAFTADIANEIQVVVLQHPSEVSHTKGTVALLAKSLRKCQVLVGESFDDEQEFLQVMAQYQLVLLYPSEQAHFLDEDVRIKLHNCQSNTQDGPHTQLTQYRLQVSIENKSKPLCLVILDATWKKAYRMFMLSTKLQQLPQVCLPDHLANAGQYHIRKVAKKNALSSLEASCYALAILEQDEQDCLPISPEHAGKYQPLLEKFQQFNQFQLSFRPEHKSLLRKLDDS